MPQYIAFLRGMNLGKRRIKMDALRAHFVDMGFDDVASFIASGNVLFTSTSRAETKLASKIEAHLRNALGYDVPTYLRTRAEIADVLAFRPFPARNGIGGEHNPRWLLAEGSHHGRRPPAHDHPDQNR